MSTFYPHTARECVSYGSNSLHVDICHFPKQLLSATGRSGDHTSSGGICGRQIDTGTGFCPSTAIISWSVSFHVCCILISTCQRLPKKNTFSGILRTPIKKSILNFLAFKEEKGIATLWKL
jgi:hypothetical protein